MAKGQNLKSGERSFYQANIKVLDQQRLKLRGYIGLPLFGKTQIWDRVDPEQYTKCCV